MCVACSGSRGAEVTLPIDPQFHLQFLDKGLELILSKPLRQVDNLINYAYRSCAYLGATLRVGGTVYLIQPLVFCFSLPGDPEKVTQGIYRRKKIKWPIAMLQTLFCSQKTSLRYENFLQFFATR